MTLQEYENKVVRASLDATALVAVIALLDENYFQRGFKALGENYWIASFDDMEGITRAILTLADGMRGALEELRCAHLDDGKEAQS